MIDKYKVLLRNQRISIEKIEKSSKSRFQRDNLGTKLNLKSGFPGFNELFVVLRRLSTAN